MHCPSLSTYQICRLKLNLDLGFLYRNRSSFTPAAKLTLIQMTILPMLNYGYLIYRSAGKGALERLDVLYHSAIRFSPNAPYWTHHCTLYSSVNWSSLYTRRKTHWLMLIYKKLLGLPPPEIPTHLLLKVPEAHTSLGHSSFQFAAARDWVELQQTLIHSKTLSWTLLLTVVAALSDVLLALPSCPLCCCLGPIMFVPCFVLLPCCAAAMCCYHVVVICCCYVIVLGLSLCSCLCCHDVCFVLYIFLFLFIFI